MPFPENSLQQVLQQVLQRMQARMPGEVDLSDSTNPSFLRIFSDVIAGERHILELDRNNILSQLFPDTAEDENLDLLGNRNRIPRIQGSKASGTIVVKNSQGSEVTPQVYQYGELSFVPRSERDSTIPSSAEKHRLEVIANDVGSDGNIPGGAQLVSPNYSSLRITSDQPFSGGRDRESNMEYRNRQQLRRLPLYGSIEDYANWAYEAGARRAWPYANEFLPGWVTILFEDEIGETPSGIAHPYAATGRFAEMQLQVQSRAPGGVRVYARAPDRINYRVNIYVERISSILASNETEINTELRDFSQSIIPGGIFYVSQVTATVSGLSSNVGILRCTVDHGLDTDNKVIGPIYTTEQNDINSIILPQYTIAQFSDAQFLQA